MNIDEFDPQAKFLFIAMMKSVLIIRKMGKKKKDFMLFAEESWNSMMMNDVDELEKIINDQMKIDVEKMRDEIEKMMNKKS